MALDLHGLWKYRELLYFLIWRDVKVRYKQTALGAAWAILQPFFTMLVFSLFFGRLANIATPVPYPLFSFSGLVIWTFFANGLTQSANSLVGSQNLITKVYFPRLTVPLATVLSGIVDLALASVVLVGMIIYYAAIGTEGIEFGWPLLLLPLPLLLAFITSLGAGLWLSALNVEYRDVRYVVPFLVQFWLFATPIAYPSDLLPEAWRVVFGLNPMVGVVDSFRWCLFGMEAPSAMVLVSALVAIVLLVSGAFYFRRMERTFADVV